jgi:hypothetical protein
MTDLVSAVATTAAAYETPEQAVRQRGRVTIRRMTWRRLPVAADVIVAMSSSVTLKVTK